MIQVYIELTNIVWVDDQDGDIAYEQGTSGSFVADIPDRDNLTSQDIDEAIADSLENESGHRPKSWYLYCFDDTCENVCAQEEYMNTVMTVITGIGAIGMLLVMCSIPALIAGGIVANLSQKNDNQQRK